MNWHIISGLPRSGSTLLAALLRQNPRFHAEMTSPLLGLLNGLVRGMSAHSDFAACFDEPRRLGILRGLVERYYQGSGVRGQGFADPCSLAPDPRICIFDTNRGWTAKLALLDQLFPAAKVICCVRDVPEIIESVERLLRRHPEQTSRLFGFQPDSNLYSRVAQMMDRERGFIGAPWCSLKEAFYGPFRDKLIVIEQERLAATPHTVLHEIHEALGEEHFHYDFEQVEYAAPEFDAALGLPGCHSVSGPVEAMTYPRTLPPDLVAANANLSFWAQGLGVF